MKLSLIDLTVILIYFVSVLMVGLYRKKVTDTTDYLLMGRRLTLPAFVMTLVSTWYGGIFAVSEFSYSYGFSNWVIMAMPYYVFGLIFAFFFAKKARQTNAFSIPDLLKRDYGQSAESISACIILLLTTPAPYVLSMGILLQYHFGLPLPLAILGSALFCFLYLLKGGFSAVVRTDILQSLLMFSGFMLLLVGAWAHFGSPLETLQVLHNKSPSHLSFTGGNPLSYIFVWFFIASWTLIDPGFHQRIYAAKSAKCARNGILISIGFWVVFDAMTTLSGLYAYTWLSQLDSPANAFLELGQIVMPAGLYGVFITGLLAVIMSTLDSTAFISGATLGRDLFPKIFRNAEKRIPLYTRIGTLIALLGACALAILIPSVIDLFYTICSIVIPALLLPILSSLSQKFIVPPKTAITNMILAPSVAILWILLPKTNWPETLQILEPFYPGMAFSLILWLTAYLLHNHRLPVSRNQSPE